MQLSISMSVLCQHLHCLFYIQMSCPASSLLLSIFFSRLMIIKVPTWYFDTLSGCPWTMYNIAMNCLTSSLLLSIFCSVLMIIKGINTQGGTAQKRLHAECPNQHQTELIPTWCVMFIESSVGDSHLMFIPDPNTVGTSHEMSKKLQWAIRWPDHYYADPTTMFLPEIIHQKKTGQIYFPVLNRMCKFPWKCMITDS